MDFQIDFGNALDKPARDETLYASEDGIASALGNDECVFQLRRTGEVHAMTTQVLTALDLCRGFRPLHEHAATIAQRVPGLSGQAEGITRVLESLVQRKLLLSDREFGSELIRPVARPSAPLRAVFIRACDRPRQLSALLDSIAAYESAHGARRSYVVLDDSRDAEAARENAGNVARLRKAGVDAKHVGATQWQGIVQQLARALPGAAGAIRGALSREGAQSFPASGGGKGYNLANLLGAGARYAMLDEDFLLSLSRPADSAPGLVLRGSPDMPVRFHATVESALAAGTAVTEDPFELHLKWCGASLGSVLGDMPVPLALRDAVRGLEPSRAPHLRAESRVVATCNGHRGSSGTAGSEWLFMLDAASRAEFWRDRDSYLHNLEAASVWFGPRMPRVLEQGHFSPFLLDGSAMLPPTRASGRSEDLLFGMLCHLGEPSSVVLHSDLAIAHVQEGARARSGALTRPDTPGFNQFLNDFLGSHLGAIRADAPAARLATAAALLRDVASASPRARRETLEEYLRFRRADLILRLQTQFAAAKDAPVYWQADVRELITVNGKALTQSRAPRLADWPESLDADACTAQFARELEQFAQVLEQWPALWDHARAQGPKMLDSVPG